jgi:DNA-binding transcriptional ArsR family regulator
LEIVNRYDEPRSMDYPAVMGAPSAEQQQPPEAGASTYPRPRRPATVREAKALAHPLRIRILRLCTLQELTNKQLADRLGSEPGTVFYHVRMLVEAGLLDPAPVRTGESGALEKPYRATGSTWWLDGPLNDAEPDARFAPIEAFQDELREAGPESVQTYARFMLHLSPEDVEELDRRILAVLDEYIETDDQRRDLPAHGGIVVVHRLAG